MINKGNTGMKIHSEEFKQRMRDNNPLKFRKRTCKGMKLKLTDQQRQERRDRIAKVNETGFENKGGRCKFYKIDGVILQGRYELYYYLVNNKQPIKCNYQIKTPYGWYRPDFEFENCFIEIKSSYTLKTCVQSGQHKKILWVSKNVKRVKIFVLQESIVNLYLTPTTNHL